MNPRTLGYCCIFLWAASICGLAGQGANGPSAPISGTYQVMKTTDAGSQVRVVVRVHLTNHGGVPLQVRQMTLADFSQPRRGNRGMALITLAPAGGGDSSQEFTIPRTELNGWQKGVLPRLLLDVETKTGVQTTVAVRLDRATAGKGE